MSAPRTAIQYVAPLYLDSRSGCLRLHILVQVLAA